MGLLQEYYGGRALPHVAQVVRGLNARGVQACVSALPRYRLAHAGVEAEKSVILGILPFLRAEGLTADLTVKLSQLGQRWLFADCVASLDEIAAHCAEHGAFLWVDMEQSSLVDLTLEAFEAAAARRDNIGICLQTYLRRTPKDLEELLKRRRPVRLVKGYYREWPPAVFGDWRDVTECFRALLRPLLTASRRPAIGTHDEGLIAEAERLAAEGLQRPEYQFFLGAKPRLPERLAAEGKASRVYIPYGALIPYLLHSLPFMDISRNLQRVLGFATIR